MNIDEIKSYRKTGEIAKKVKIFAREIIKKDVPLLEIAEKIEAKIIELGAVPAFPVNLSIDDIAAHFTPSHDDETLASGLLKIDLGVAIEGHISDTAFTLDLENSEENKKLIESSERALKNAIEKLKKTKQINLIGKEIQETISSQGFSPINNLSGHSLSKYEIHAGVTIPNFNNNNTHELQEGAYAIEPFSTTGEGKVYDGKPSGIYNLKRPSGIRDPLARKIIAFIEENYVTMPFCARWIVKEFGPRALISLRLMENQGIIHQYNQLVEKAHKKVSQAEHSVLLINGEVEVLT